MLNHFLGQKLLFKAKKPVTRRCCKVLQEVRRDEMMWSLKQRSHVVFLFFIIFFYFKGPSRLYWTDIEKKNPVYTTKMLIRRAWLQIFISRHLLSSIRRVFSTASTKGTTSTMLYSFKTSRMVVKRRFSMSVAPPRIASKLSEKLLCNC